MGLERFPELLTVEEAAGVLRIGRGLAYELARRWEATDGREGIPVIRLGRLLRVPRGQLELMVAGPALAADTFEADEPPTRSRRAHASTPRQSTLPFHS